MSILETEKRKEERGKLGCILIDRLIKKFGRYLCVSQHCIVSDQTNSHLRCDTSLSASTLASSLSSWKSF